MDVDSREVRTAREVAREIGSLISELEKGSLEKVVVVQQGRMRAVLLSVDAFDQLRALAQ